MGYQTSIKRNVKKAFAAMKDLVVNIELSSSTSAGFDFGASAPKATTVKLSPIKALPVTKTKRAGSEGVETEQQSFIVMAEGLPSLSAYDTVAITNSPSSALNNTNWKIILPMTNDGFVVTINVSATGAENG